MDSMVERMAVDYIHRLVVVGRRESVAALRRQLARRTIRQLGKQRWTEHVAFSFESLFEIAPSARRVESEPPWDPYDLSVWPTRRLDGDSRSEVRYQFHTRNLEMAGLIRELSRSVPTVTFVLVTFCLDDGSITSYRTLAGRERSWFVRPKLETTRWREAQRKYGLSDDKLYEDEEARGYAEELLLADALARWLPAEKDRRRKRRWDDRPAARDLETEREILSLELTLKPKDKRKGQRAKPGKPRTLK
jgi:hypothetical protein